MDKATALSASMAESTTPAILSLSPCLPSLPPAASPIFQQVPLFKSGY